VVAATETWLLFRLPCFARTQPQAARTLVADDG
jgi:hypothetical protein